MVILHMVYKGQYIQHIVEKQGKNEKECLRNQNRSFIGHKIFSRLLQEGTGLETPGMTLLTSFYVYGKINSYFNNVFNALEREKVV